mmetsp:Transcript_24802/g.44884  ORF Transcript_24802/g.44884 Transcript_24802/m.44884 type:complete len:115 (-) Transcript_24802:509-853(-)
MVMIVIVKPFFEEESMELLLTSKISRLYQLFHFYLPESLRFWIDLKFTFEFCIRCCCVKVAAVVIGVLRFVVSAILGFAVVILGFAFVVPGSLVHVVILGCCPTLVLLLFELLF